MSRFTEHTFTAPTNWAVYLINGDCSGMEDDDAAACDAWIASINLGWPCDVNDEGFMHWHDARQFSPYAGDCSTYTFLVDAGA